MPRTGHSSKSPFTHLLCDCLFWLQGVITNRPLAGTIRRGKTTKEDLILEKQLLDDEKQCAEHIMLVDLGRNDVGKVILLFSHTLIYYSLDWKLLGTFFFYTKYRISCWTPQWDAIFCILPAVDPSI